MNKMILKMINIHFIYDKCSNLKKYKKYLINSYTINIRNYQLKQ
jgi:hypothetical protein